MTSAIDLVKQFLFASLCAVSLLGLLGLGFGDLLGGGEKEEAKDGSAGIGALGKGAGGGAALGGAIGGAAGGEKGAMIGIGAGAIVGGALGAATEAEAKENKEEAAEERKSTQGSRDTGGDK